MREILKVCLLAVIIFAGLAVATNAAAQQSGQTEVIEYYAIPSPDEILSYIHNNEISYTPSLLTNPDNSSHYQTSTDQMLAFGIYLADMAYAVSFEQSGTALRFFEVTESMGKSMNIFPPEILNIGERLLRSLDNLDSINALYDEMYLVVISSLHDAGRFGEYATISAGGVVEALYLALNSRDSKIKEDAFRMRVWEQKMILEQLETMSNKYLNESQKKKILGDMKDLYAAFDEIPSQDATTNAEKRNDGAVVLGSTKPTLKPASIDIIHKAVNDLRAKWVK